MNTKTESVNRPEYWLENNFLNHDNELMVKAGENLQYYLDHVEEFESGDVNIGDLPNFKDEIKLATHAGVMFGTSADMANGTLYIVTVDNEFVGAYGHEDNANDRADDLREERGGKVAVQPVTPEQSPPVSKIKPLLDSEHEVSQAIGKNLQYIHNHMEEWFDGSGSPDDLPHLPDDEKYMLTYSVMFGILWELDHPALYAVFESPEGFVNIYGERNLAEVATLEHEDYYVQRISVVDGYKPPEEIIGPIGF